MAHQILPTNILFDSYWVLSNFPPLVCNSTNEDPKQSVGFSETLLWTRWELQEQGLPFWFQQLWWQSITAASVHLVWVTLQQKPFLMGGSGGKGWRKQPLTDSESLFMQMMGQGKPDRRLCLRVRMCIFIAFKKGVCGENHSYHLVLMTKDYTSI